METMLLRRRHTSALGWLIGILCVLLLVQTAQTQLAMPAASQVHAPVPTSPQILGPAAANDPSLGLGMTNVIKNDVAKTYFQSELHVPTDRDYVSLTLDLNLKWNWRQEQKPWHPSFYTNAMPKVADYMKKHSETRLLVVSGYFDLAVPVLSSRYAVDHSEIPLDRVIFALFESGHSTFSGDAALTRMGQVMHSFLLGK